MKKLILGLVSCMCLSACSENPQLAVTPGISDLNFHHLPLVWDEAIPLGNATIGALVWQKDSVLRLSLDRIDLWDLRPNDSISGANYRFSWVYNQVQKKDYAPVQNKLDWPYDNIAVPSKIPGAALEFPVKSGKATRCHLYLNNALSEVTWDNGTRLQTFVHATEPVGWFVFENLPDTVSPVLVTPPYGHSEGIEDHHSQAGALLTRLGYPQGETQQKEGLITYHQPGADGFYYDVAVRYERKGSTLTGNWSITSSLTDQKATEETLQAWQRGIYADYQSHQHFWNDYWAQSSVALPDSVLQKQYDNEMYKFGSAARENSYPISLQSVWTADNGMLPPWKGDYHHDLNTQLSYWPAYTGNHLTEAMGYLNTLWNQREVYKKYTRQYFETEGMNIPGVCTLTGEPMGGWIQYSMSPTVSAWLSQHFYLQWKYSGDAQFLQKRAYPFVKDAAIFLEQFTQVDSNGVRTLPLSSSPEIRDNSIDAWFKTMTNYDLALSKFLFQAAREMATVLGLKDEAAHWQAVGLQFPDFDLDEDGALTIAKGLPYQTSHRHFSHVMAIHPLGMIDWSQGEKSQKIITASLQKIADMGPDWWCGYTYSWYANLKARAFDGEGAAQALRTFAECFCLPNTFHANGDQSRSGKSKFTYRPFTLEGNFAFAAAIQEMLLQSHTSIVRLFPALPADWKNVSFRRLRAQGGFLVSATLQDGKLFSYAIESEQGGEIHLALPQGTSIHGKTLLDFSMKKGEKIYWSSED